MTADEFNYLPAHKQDEYTQRPDCPIGIKVLYLDDDQDDCGNLRHTGNKDARR